MLEREQMKIKELKDIINDLPDDMEIWAATEGGDVHDVTGAYDWNVCRDIEDLGGTPTKEDDFPYLMIELEEAK